ncbi:mirror-image polydactyly gene 1 protein isoform X2 [Myripristis murdjan]|nr:mirror-image polydactyly gene 1 protein-like isoform X2 [Myripristis murdjan]
MYHANPRVNVELRRRLPSGLNTQHSSPAGGGAGTCPPSPTSLLPDWPQAPQHLDDFHDPATSKPPSPQACRPPAAAAGGMEVDVPSRGPSPRAESSAGGADGSRASGSPGSPVSRKHLVTTDSSIPLQDSVPAPAGRVLALDQDKNISFLLKELDSLRDINKKLQAQLVQKEQELQRREVEEELREVQQEAQSWERPTAVLEELLSAQRERDQALMSRLLLANEERDEALLRAQRLLQAAAELEDMNLEENDMGVDELLQCVCAADSVQEVERFGSALVQRLQSARQRRQDITAQEMKAVMEERDGGVARSKQLEQDLVQQRADKEELLRLQSERDGAVEDRRRLEAELQALRAYHSLQQSQSGSLDVLSSEMPPPSGPCDPPPGGAGPPPGGAGPPPGGAGPPPGGAGLVLQLQQLSREKQCVEAELERCQRAEGEARERVQRLERLVEVLRKKVGTGSVRAVI